MARGGARGFFVVFRGGSLFLVQPGGANLFFCPPDFVFISDDHAINATSLTVPVQRHAVLDHSAAERHVTLDCDSLLQFQLSLDRPSSVELQDKQVVHHS